MTGDQKSALELTFWKSWYGKNKYGTPPRTLINRFKEINCTQKFKLVNIEYVKLYSQYSTVLFFYKLHGEKWPQWHNFYEVIKVFHNKRILNGSHFFYVEKARAVSPSRLSFLCLSPSSRCFFVLKLKIREVPITCYCI